MKSFVFGLILSLFTMTALAHPSHDHDGGHLVFADGKLHAHLQWVKGPHLSTGSGESVLRIDFMNPSTHANIDPNAQIKVVLWMPDMNHGSSPTRVDPVLDATKQPVAGAFQVSKINFIMGGAWDVRVTLKFADGTEETQTLNVHLNGGHGRHSH